MNKTEQLLNSLKKLILEEQRCQSSNEVAAVVKELEKIIVDDIKLITARTKAM